MKYFKLFKKNSDVKRVCKPKVEPRQRMLENVYLTQTFIENLISFRCDEGFCLREDICTLEIFSKEPWDISFVGV